MTTCLRSCDMNAIGDAVALHGKFASVLIIVIQIKF